MSGLWTAQELDRAKARVTELEMENRGLQGRELELAREHEDYEFDAERATQVRASEHVRGCADATRFRDVNDISGEHE